MAQDDGVCIVYVYCTDTWCGGEWTRGQAMFASLAPRGLNKWDYARTDEVILLTFAITQCVLPVLAFTRYKFFIGQN